MLGPQVSALDAQPRWPRWSTPTNQSIIYNHRALRMTVNPQSSITPTATSVHLAHMRHTDTRPFASAETFCPNVAPVGQRLRSATRTLTCGQSSSSSPTHQRLFILQRPLVRAAPGHGSAVCGASVGSSLPRREGKPGGQMCESARGSNHPIRVSSSAGVRQGNSE